MGEWSGMLYDVSAGPWCGVQEARQLLEKLEQMEQALADEQRELDAQRRIIEIEHREAAMYPDLEEEVTAPGAQQGMPSPPPSPSPPPGHRHPCCA
jgi:hypothetical protein